MRIDVFAEMRNYIYTGSTNNLNRFAHELYQAAEKYQLEGLKKEAQFSMESNATVSNVAVDPLPTADEGQQASLEVRI